MILLKDIFSLLASGEFSNLSLSKDRNGNIDEADYGKVIGHINLALVEIYKRFKLKEEEIVLHVNPIVTTYYLRPEFMTSLENISTTRYIQRPTDSDGSLNIIEIKDIFDADENRIVLNNRFYTPYIRQSSDDTLKITGITEATTLSIILQSYPSPIVLDDDFDINTYKLDISKNILEAILNYVAARVYKPIGANNSTTNADKGSSYDHKYELACQKIEQFGLHIDDDDKDPDKFSRQGWA